MKFCPFRANNYPDECIEDTCAWWCAWANSCALTVMAMNASQAVSKINIDKEFNERFGKKVD